MPLDSFSRHDNYQDLLLPNHLPEIWKGLWQRPLREDEGSRLLIAIDKVRVDVIRVAFVRALKK